MIGNLFKALDPDISAVMVKWRGRLITTILIFIAIFAFPNLVTVIMVDAVPDPRNGRPPWLMRPYTPLWLG
jgi:uncharacterized membrane protein